MCSPRVMQKVADDMQKLGLLGLIGAAALIVPGMVSGSSTQQASGVKVDLSKGFKVHDLTQTLSAESPLYPGYSPMETKALYSREKNGYYVNRISYDEHSGTHVDAPAHFSDGATVDKIPVGQLVAPLAVIDISERTSKNEDAQVMPDDILAWEKQHGKLPAGAFVAMYC